MGANNNINVCHQKGHIVSILSAHSPESITRFCAKQNVLSARIKWYGDVLKVDYTEEFDQGLSEE